MASSSFLFFFVGGGANLNGEAMDNPKSPERRVLVCLAKFSRVQVLHVGHRVALSDGEKN